MTMANFEKIPSFNEFTVKVRNHKNGKLVKIRPEHLWPL